VIWNLFSISVIDRLANYSLDALGGYMNRIVLRIRHVIAAVLYLGFASSVAAVTGAIEAKSAAGKYGIINMQAVILNVEEGKQARGRLEKEIEKKEKELSEKKKELDKMNEEWKTQAAVLSESARMQKQQEFQEKFLGLRNDEMTFQQEMKREEQKVTQQIAIKVQKLVEKIANEQKLEAVFESNTSGLLFLKDPVDLTEQVIAKYGKEAAPPTAKLDEKK
jgi:outer membrane protein